MSASSLQTIGNGLLTHGMTVLTVLNTLLHCLTHSCLHRYPPFLVRASVVNLRGFLVRSFLEDTRFLPIIGDGNTTTTRNSEEHETKSPASPIALIRRCCPGEEVSTGVRCFLTDR